MRHGIKLIFEHMTQKDVRSIVPLDAGITNDNYLINALTLKENVILKSYKIDDNNTLNGYVVFNDSSSLEIIINNKMDVSHYKIYDYIIKQ